MKNKIEILKDGTNYWGDFLLLHVLCSILHINVFILQCDTDRYDIYNTMIEYNPNYKTIILVYQDSIHFTLVGKFINHQMEYLFTQKSLPSEIKGLYNI